MYHSCSMSGYKRSVCVFCGSHSGNNQSLVENAQALGQFMADNELRLVYGGASSGIMGAIADGVLHNSGVVLSIYPNFLSTMEPMHEGVTEQIIVEDMHNRKMKMFENSDMFVVLPGGFGTLDEAFEIITWKQIGTHDKQIFIHNDSGYWDKWVELTERIIDSGFARPVTRTMYKITNSQEELFKALLAGRH